ncbi:PREDICTED: latrophilin Cirl isoform X3 [Nicrophorus vespilloides]|uniref:Latrophilin Cirl isoform X3 n=1 Tax=Nicrophorus vespilloides TaxID=110193 RepID=A0ABM1MHG5_NICVS|nr:PREDICTED: latrophilin Cirl isoform X3 [Nicrophorus vespilloides]
MAWHGVARPGLVLLLYALCFYAKGAAAKAMEVSIRYDTAYACEGKILKIECKDGELIKLIRANYGRFSITICNDHGNTDWSVNCMSAKSLRVLHSRCYDKQNCSIPASTSMFGDPCPGTLKYLEAHYQCAPATMTTTTNRPSPPWLITSQPPMWSTIKTSARPPPPPPPKVSTVTSPPPKPPTTPSLSIHTSTSLKPIPVQPPISALDDDIRERTKDRQEQQQQYGKGAELPQKIPDEITSVAFTTAHPKKYTVDSSAVSAVNTYVPSPSLIPAVPGDNDLDYCSPVILRNIYWNWTRAGDISVQPCPGGTTGFARWKCIRTDAESQWSTLTPDLSECRSLWLTSLEQRISSDEDKLLAITSDLAKVTTSKTLYGGDMMITTKIIKSMAHKMAMDIQTFSDPRQREVIVTELLSDVVRTGSNLLDFSQHPSWRDLSHQEQMRVATSLLIGLEENAFLLADTVMREKTVDQVVKNIMLSVRVLDTKTVTTERFPSANKWSASNDTIELPQVPLLDNSDGSLVRLVFVAFDRLEEILQWHPDSSEANSGKNLTRILNSKIISASLGKGRHIQLREPVRLTLRHLQTDNVTNPSCVFWDYTSNAWSEEGCHVEGTNYTHTTCLCNHLTNFAILMDVRSVYLPPGHQLALQIVTYVGCIISVICLILAIITFQLFRGLKSDRTTIHSNLCVCLLIAEVLFLAGIGRTENQIACGVIAAVMQYVFLCAFAWMFFEGFHLYVMLIEVFEAEKSRVRWYYIIAYGAPMLIVGISVLVNFSHGYGTEQYCWLRPGNQFIYSFVVPVGAVLLFNLIFLLMAITKMCRHANATVSMKNKEQSRLASTSGKEENALQTKIHAHLSWIKGAIVLVFLLGLTWTFGFLYLDKETVVMAYIFAILNTLQGFFIFIFHCVQNEKVRKEYRKFIRNHSWLPKCLRCSKPNTSSSSGSGSSGLGKEGRTSLYAGSNGNPSAPSVDNVLSPHGTSLQRDWNSRSCTSMNRVGKVTVPASTMAATLCRPQRMGAAVVEPPNTSTLPYIRNFYKQSAVNANLPKSASTWGPLHNPLHWKNISFKSYSRDSGHGGSEQEDSPRSHAMLTDGRMNSTKDTRRQPYISEYNHAIANNLQMEYGRRTDSLPHPKHLPLPQAHGMRKKNGSLLRATSPWNHTYTEIHDARMQRGQVPEDDPVYEEIERNEIQVSDMSDEDGKRQSDMSRQSSRSYGDHRPLIPYSPANDRSIHSCLDGQMDVYQSRRNMYRGDAARSLAAVLDGETVVCHLEPPDIYPHDPYNARTLVLPQYGDS